MIVLGLTGSIGMGKSTAATRLRELGLPVFDADACVHQLYESGAVEAIESAFPGTTSAGGVDRAKLSAALARDPSGFARLEAIVHPMVREREAAFLTQSFESGAATAVLEIPLLYETGLDQAVDAVMVVSASPETQQARVLARPGMTPEKFAQILSRQLPDAEKRARAHFVVDTNASPADCARQVDAMLSALSGRAARAFDEHWREG